MSDEEDDDDQHQNDISIHTLAARIAKECEYPLDDVRFIVARLIDEMAAEMAKGNAVYIRRLGWLSVECRTQPITAAPFGQPGYTTKTEAHVVAPRFRAVRVFRALVRSLRFPEDKFRASDGPPDKPRSRRGQYEVQEQRRQRRLRRKAKQDGQNQSTDQTDTAGDVQRP